MKRRYAQYSRLAPYVFVAPFVITFGTFIAYPILMSVEMATQQNAGPSATEYVGAKNLVWMWQDPDFRKAVTNTLIFAAASLFVQLPCSLGLALLLNRKQVKGRAFWRLIFFSPSLVGLAFVAVLANLIFEKNTGMLNVVLHQLFGFNIEFPWLQEYVMLALIIAAFWMYVGYNMVYFLAALQNVSPDLLEAAQVDGARAWHRFIHVTLPAIRPVGLFVVLLSLIGSCQLFELPYILLDNTGGPQNQGLTVVIYLYQRGFTYGDLGYASAVGWVLAIGLMVAAFFQQKLSAVDR